MRRKNFTAKIMALLLAVLMTVTICPLTAFADSLSEQMPSYTHYVPIGTSITGGYGLNHSNRNAAVGSFGKGAYPRLIADDFDIEGRYDGALLGTRGYEFRLILEDDLHAKDEFTEGWANAKCGNGETKLKRIASVYKENLAKADLITIELGSNDLMSYLIFQLMDYVEEMAEGTRAETQISELIDAMRESGEGDMFTGLMAIVNSYGSYLELLPQLLADETKSITDFQTDFVAILDDIQAIKNETDDSVPYADTQIVVTSVYNPFDFLMKNEVTNDANGSGTMRELFMEAGILLNLPQSMMTSIVDVLTNPMVSSINTFLSTGNKHARDKNYLYVDVTNIDLTGSADGTHPDFAGHTYIAEHIETALLNQYREQNHLECSHRHTTVQGAVAPTRYRSGSTGSVVCLDCGATLERSKTLTYSEYQKQQAQNPGDEEQTAVSYPKVPYSVLAFTSDVHNTTDNTSANRLKNWIVRTQENEGAFDFLGFCGDNATGNNTARGDAYWDLAEKVFDLVKDSDVPYYAFTTGNHEQEHGYYGLSGEGTTHAAAQNVVRNTPAEIKDGANYAIYCFGAAPVDNSNDYKFLNEEIQALDTYLKGIDSNIPVFVLSHYPLHNSGGRTIQNVAGVIRVLNQYPNVIFVWGHNHTNADNQEKHYDQVISGRIDSTPINFTYAAAGCMSDSEYSSGSKAVKGKGLIATVSPENEVTLVYVDANGQELGTPVVVDLDGPEPQQPAAKIEGEYAYRKVDTLESGKQYLIVNNENDWALDTMLCAGYANQTNAYSGFKGSKVTIGTIGEEPETIRAVTNDVTEDMIWEFASSGRGYTIKNVLNGTYLNATYARSSSNGNPATSTLKADETKDIWTLNGSTLKSNNANNQYLTFDTNKDEANFESEFFTVRSSGTGVSFYEVTGKPVEEVEPTVPETPQTDGKKYIIVSQGFGLTAKANDGYLNQNGYAYKGFDGKPVVVSARKISSYITEDMVWELEPVGTGYYIKKAGTNSYLSAVYGKDRNGKTTKGGDLFLSEGKDDIWTLSGSTLKSTNASNNSDRKTLYLAYDTEDTVDPITSGDVNFFTIRSKGTGVAFYDVTEILNNQGEEIGQCIALSKIGDNTYNIVINNRVIGVEHGGVLTASEVPADLSTLSNGFVWKIASSGEGWTIQNAETKQYLGIYSTTTSRNSVSASVNLTTQAYVWGYDNGFTATVTVSGLLGIKSEETYYLAVNGMRVAMSDVAVGNGTSFYKHFPAHSFVQAANDGKIVYTCTRCHMSYETECPGHVYDKTTHYCTKCGAGDPAYIPQCVVEKSVALTEGELLFTLGGHELGAYTFARSGNGWTIWGADGKYLTLSSNALTRTDSPFVWTFSNNRFSAAGTSSSSGLLSILFGLGSSRSSTYYLVYSGGQLTVSTSTTGATAAFVQKAEKLTHTYGQWTPAANGQHKHTCTVCGDVAYADCDYGKPDHKCPDCGQIDPKLEYVTATFVTGQGATTAPAAQTVVKNEGTITKPATAPTRVGYLFDGWYADDAVSEFVFTTVLTENVTLTAKWNTCSEHAYGEETHICTKCGARDPEAVPPCTGEKSVALKAGKLTFTLGGAKQGEFTFAKFGNGWTIQDNNNQYLALSNNVLTRTGSPFVWTFSNNRFSAAGTSSSSGLLSILFGLGSSRSSTYYLAYTSGRLTASTSTTGATAAFAEAVESDSHSFGAWTAAANGKHVRTCSVCGYQEDGECHYGDDDKCTTCGRHDPSKANIQVSVSLSQRTSGGLSGILSLFGLGRATTTYTATINVQAVGTTARTVQYSTNNGSSWTTGTTVSSNSQITNFLIRVTDGNGDVHNFRYADGSVSEMG